MKSHVAENLMVRTLFKVQPQCWILMDICLNDSDASEQLVHALALMYVGDVCYYYVSCVRQCIFITV